MPSSDKPIATKVRKLESKRRFSPDDVTLPEFSSPGTSSARDDRLRYWRILLIGVVSAIGFGVGFFLG